MKPGIARPPALGKRLRAALMGLGTVTGLAKRGFFLPYRYAATLENEASAGCYDALAPYFAAAQPQMRRLIGEIQRHAAALGAIGRGSVPAPRWAQGWFPRLDAAAAYALVRSTAPSRIVEVGSGHSTRFLAAAMADSGRKGGITAIDPQPRATITGLNIQILRTTIQKVDIGRLINASGDILFVDSSHLLVPGSDVDVLINSVWPRLPVGAVVHFHDVFLPDGYPTAWRWRGYNEQLAIAPLITSGAAEIMFASHFVMTRMAAELADTVIARLPLPDGALESSLWLRKTTPPVAGAAR